MFEDDANKRNFDLAKNLINQRFSRDDNEQVLITIFVLAKF